MRRSPFRLRLLFFLIVNFDQARITAYWADSGVWESPFSEVQCLLLSAVPSLRYVSINQSRPVLSVLLSLQWHSITRLQGQQHAVGFHQPPETDLLPYGVLQVLLHYIFWCISAILVWLDGLSLQQATESSIVDLCSQCKWNKNMTTCVWPNVPL